MVFPIHVGPEAFVSCADPYSCLQFEIREGGQTPLTLPFDYICFRFGLSITDRFNIRSIP